MSNNRALFPKLIEGLWSENPLVRMRAADVAEKVTRKNPEFLKPYRRELLGLMNEADEPELRWHLAVLVPRLPLNAKDRQLAASSLNSYLNDRSSLVRTFALQGLADLGQADSNIRPRVIDLLRGATRSGTPAMKARSRKLLSRLERAWQQHSSDLPGSKSSTQTLRAIALRHPEVEEVIACKGTPLESRAFKVRKKTFLFTRDIEMMVKLQDSLPEAKEHASQDPSRYRVSAAWVSVRFGAGALPPRDLLTRWVAESYSIMAGRPAKQSKSGSLPAKTKAAKKHR